MYTTPNQVVRKATLTSNLPVFKAVPVTRRLAFRYEFATSRKTYPTLDWWFSSQSDCPTFPDLAWIRFWRLRQNNGGIHRRSNVPWDLRNEIEIDRRYVCPLHPFLDALKGATMKSGYPTKDITLHELRNAFPEITVGRIISKKTVGRFSAILCQHRLA